ncbi:MAG TPA: hypothetical protein VF164_10210 [Trueperaceae bacterium]
MTGTTVRMGRVFRPNGRTVIIAMDHGLPGMFPLGRLQDPAALLADIAAAGADAVLTTPGIAKRFAAHLGRLGLIVRLDGGATSVGDAPKTSSLIASVEDALRLGADAVAVMGICGTEEEGRSLATLGAVAKECRTCHVPLLAEMLPLGFGGDPSVEELAVAARVGAEMGADIIKTKYVGTPDEYRFVTESCFAPVVVLGGSERDLGHVTATVRESMSSGAAGVAMGRNVWRAPDARAAVAAIVDAVHGPTGNGQ